MARRAGRPRGQSRGKSGLHRAMVPGNARAGQPDGKRHRDRTARRPRRARVKRWGKSPPGRWQQGPHGKPHQEQCRIGIARRLDPQGYRGRVALARAIRVGSLRPAATRCPEEWSSNRRKPGNRIRLTGPPRINGPVEGALPPASPSSGAFENQRRGCAFSYFHLAENTPAGGNSEPSGASR